MGLFIINKRDGADEVRRMKSLLHESQENLKEVSEIVERAEIEMERGGYREPYGERSRYREHLEDQDRYREGRDRYREDLEREHYGERRRY